MTKSELQITLEEEMGEATVITCGFTQVRRSDDNLRISHGGNMGNSIVHSVNPNLRSMGLPTVGEMKKCLTVISERGTPDYSWSIEFKDAFQPRWLDS